MSFFLFQVGQSSYYTNNIVLVFGILMVASLGYWLYLLKKRNPDLDIGPLIATAMTDKHETIFMALIFLEYVASSLIAATVHGPHSTGLEMSPLGRVLAHIALSVTGTVCQFVLATDIATIFVKNQPVGNRIGNFLTMLLVGGLAFYIPYLNLTLIASSTGESIAFQTWWYSLNPFISDSELQALYMQLGYPPNYRPWAALSPILHVCIATSGIIHYGLTPIEGLRTVSSSKRRGLLMRRVLKDLEIPEEKEEKDKPDGKGALKNPMRGEQEKITQIIPNAEFLLSRIGYSDPTKKKALAQSVQRAILGDNSDAAKADALKLGYRLANLVALGKTIDSRNEPNKKEQNDNLIKDIRAFISGDAKDSSGKLLPVDKRGLKISLKN